MLRAFLLLLSLGFVHPLVGQERRGQDPVPQDNRQPTPDPKPKPRPKPKPKPIKKKKRKKRKQRRTPPKGSGDSRFNAPGIMGRLGFGLAFPKFNGNDGAKKGDPHLDLTQPSDGLMFEPIGYNAGSFWSVFLNYQSTHDSVPQWKRQTTFLGLRLAYNLHLSRQGSRVISQLHAGLLLGAVSQDFNRKGEMTEGGEDDVPTYANTLEFSGTGYGVGVGFDYLFLVFLGVSVGVDWYMADFDSVAGTGDYAKASEVYENLASKTSVEVTTVYVGMFYLLNVD